MAADLFETYIVTVVATMVLASIFFVGDLKDTMMMYPLSIAGVCILASIIGTYFVRLGKNENIMFALYKGFFATSMLSAIFLYFITDHVIGTDSTFLIGEKSFTGISLFYCGLIGLIITGLIIWVTEYYTGTNYRPVQSIAKASTTGHGTNVIQGLAISLEATALPAIIHSLLVCASLVHSFAHNPTLPCLCMC
jgi:K(+)-stimulated pyrophosphate-energized sodium pump